MFPNRILVFFIVFVCCAFSKPEANVCLGCTAGIRLIQEYSEWQKVPCVTLLEDICKIIPTTPTWEKWSKLCFEFMNVTGPLICFMIQEGISPDKQCRKITLCNGFEQCTLYKNMTEVTGEQRRFPNEPSNVKMELLKLKILDVLTKEKSNDDPYVPPKINDEDGDYYSTFFAKRGYAWRGRDCNDSSSEIYPGRKESKLGPHVDHNCNGIYGVDKEGTSYEEKFCSKTERRGVIAFGDSACAHFRIPEQFFEPSMEWDDLKYLFEIIENEADWPHLGVYQGFMNDTTGLTPGKVESIYLHLRGKNRCNHRDYQSLCFNGASSTNIHEIKDTISRHVDLDHPAVIFIANVGNDVCSRHTDFDHMTKPQVFYDDNVELLKFIDTKVPPNSHVVLVGLADGTFLYKYLHNKSHPLGVNYEDVYNYMICLGNAPCWGFMSSNKTVREKTLERVIELSSQYVKIIEDHKFANFDMHFLNSTYLEYIQVEEWIKKGRDEPLDGFHPSQAALPLVTQTFIDELNKQDPRILGEVNPFNDEIKKIFGDQGGH